MSMAIRWRSDLEVIRLPLGGGVRVCDPIDSRHFEFSEEQWYAIGCLEQHEHPQQWIGFLTERERDRSTAFQGWSLFLSRLVDEGLVRVAGNSSLSIKRRTEKKGRWWASPWAIRLGGIPAERITQQLHHVLGPLLQARVLGLATLFIGFTLLMMLGFAPRLIGEGAEILPWLVQQQPWLMPVLLVTVKACHELGHAVMARHVGGGCRELGVMLFVGSPCLYADVSQCWMVPERSKRASVTLAGSWVESVLASLAFWLWLSTGPGILHSAAWFVIVVVVLGNLLLNLNPLMRYDGYYLLSDLWGIPNLHQQAREAAIRFWDQMLFGRSKAADASNGALLLPTGWQRREVGLIAFAMIAWVYRLLVIVLIVGGLVWWLSSYGLGWLATGLGAVWIFSGFVGPIFRTASGLFSAPRAPEQRWRGGLIAIGITLLLLVLLGFPLPDRVSGTGSVQAIGAQPLYVSEASRFLQGSDREQRIVAGTLVAELSSPDLEAQLLQKERERELLRTKIEQARMSEFSLDTGESLLGLRASLERIENELQVIVGRRERLSLEATCDGWLVPNYLACTAAANSEELSTWWGDPFHETNRGAWLEEGTLLGWIVPEKSSFEVWTQIDPRDLAAVQVSAKAWLKLGTAGDHWIEGRVVEVGLSHGVDSTLRDETWGDWLSRISSGQTIDRRIAWVRIEAEPKATPVSSWTHATSDQILSNEVGYLHDEPVQVRIESADASLSYRAWRWVSGQWHWAW